MGMTSNFNMLFMRKEGRVPSIICNLPLFVLHFQISFEESRTSFDLCQSLRLLLFLAVAHPPLPLSRSLTAKVNLCFLLPDTLPNFVSEPWLLHNPGSQPHNPFSTLHQLYCGWVLMHRCNCPNSSIVKKIKDPEPAIPGWGKCICLEHKD